MEYLSRSWSASALEVSKTLSPHISTLLIKPPPPTTTTTTTITSSSSITTVDSEETDHHHHHHHLHHSNTISRNPLFSSQRVLDRIMSQSSQPRHQQDSPLTSGRPSLSSDPTASADSPTIVSSPPQEFYDVVKFLRSNNTPPQPQFTGGRIATVSSGGGGNKTVGRWLKDRKEKKREEARAHNAQLHAAISVAGVAAAVAAIAAATAASSGSGKEENMGETTDTAVASAATLVAAQCVEAAEAMGAERDHLVSVINSAVNVHSYDDIVTLTAAAATALRGAATLKARVLKEVRNVAAAETPAPPVPKARGRTMNPNNNCYINGSYSGELAGYNQEFLARGCELLKRTRKGDLHWKIVSVYLHRSGQVMLKMKSRHVAGTITKKKKNVVLDVCKNMHAWPGRHFLEGGEQCCYFGLKTEMRGMVEFECKNQREHDMWTQGISNLLSIVAERKYRCRT